MVPEIDDILEKTDLFDHVTDIDRQIFHSPYHSVTIPQTNAGYEIYIGPHDPYQGGSGITICLNGDFSYITHISETLEAEPDMPSGDEDL